MRTNVVGFVQCSSSISADQQSLLKAVCNNDAVNCELFGVRSIEALSPIVSALALTSLPAGAHFALTLQVRMWRSLAADTGDVVVCVHVYINNGVRLLQFPLVTVIVHIIGCGCRIVYGQRGNRAMRYSIDRRLRSLHVVVGSRRRRVRIQRSQIELINILC